MQHPATMTRAGGGTGCRWMAVVVGTVLTLAGRPATAQQMPLLGVRPFNGQATALGKPNHVFHYYVEADRGWGGLDGSDREAARVDEVRAARGRFPDRLILISYAGMPRSGATLEGCADGAYDARYRSYGRAMQEAGLGRIVLRIGWEWDGSANPMGIEGDSGKAVLYRRCFRNIARNVRAGYGGSAGGILFDFNSTTGIAHRGGLPLLNSGYPGDDVVDIVSVEGFDNRPCAQPADAACRWGRVLRSLTLVRDFARARGKRMAIPEWAVWNTTGSPDPYHIQGFDNPMHVRNLCAFARDPANNVLYYVYFNGSRRSPWYDLTEPRNRRAAEAFATYCDSGPG